MVVLQTYGQQALKIFKVVCQTDTKQLTASVEEVTNLQSFVRTYDLVSRISDAVYVNVVAGIVVRIHQRFIHPNIFVLKEIKLFS